MFLNDLKFALRSLARAKGLSITVVLTLALGIGANAAIFSVVRGVLLRRLVPPLRVAGHGRDGHRGRSFQATSLSVRGSDGIPRTRSAMMLRRISDVPPSIELPFARRYR